MDASPTKRRVLGALDANAQSPATNRTSKLEQVKPSLSRDAIMNSKRSNENAGEPSPKRQRILPVSPPRQPAVLSAEGTPAKPDRDMSASPEPSSIFDTSVIDTSQVTCATEPDIAEDVVPSPPRPSRRPTITREEARQKAEILRLRLGLAGYKLRTGQENVPLERLQVRRVLPRDKKGPQELARRSSDSEQRRSEDGQATTASRSGDGQRHVLPVPHAVSDVHPSPEKSALPRLPLVSFGTPTRTRFDDEGDRLTSSAIKGGAAKGLLSLSRS